MSNPSTIESVYASSTWFRLRHGPENAQVGNDPAARTDQRQRLLGGKLAFLV